MDEFQVSLSGKKVEGRFWKYEGKMTDEKGKGKDGNGKYPPAVFLRISKAGTSLYGFTPDEGIKAGYTLVVNRSDLIALLKGKNKNGDAVEFAKMGILKPTGNVA